MDIPIIDLTQSEGAIAAAIDEACREIGFLSAVGHGVPADVISDAWLAAAAFFELEEEEKLLSHTGTFYGYSPLRGESLATTRGVEAPPDLKESFNLGPIHLGLPEIVWPVHPEGFRRAWTAYYEAMEGLAARLLGLFALALGLPGTALTQHFDRHTSALRALNYPAFSSPAAEGQVRAGAHSDYGSLTILLPGEGRGGLEVLDRTGRWLPVPLIEGGFVINVGDLMQRWTNDRWVSTVHRVVNPPADVAKSERRQSMAFFQNCENSGSLTILATALIETLPTCVRPGEQVRYEPVVFGDWLQAKVEAATGG